MVGLSIVPPVSAFAIVMGRKVRSVSRELQVTNQKHWILLTNQSPIIHKSQDSLAASTEMAEEKLSNIRTVRSFAMESREINSYKLTMDNVLQKAYKEAMINAKFYGTTGRTNKKTLHTT